MDCADIRHPKDLRNDEELKEAIEVILKKVDPNPDRPGLARTPYRIAKAFEEWYGGYGKDSYEILNRTFTQKSDMVMEGPIKFFSQCEHHMAPFYGSIWVAYIPGKDPDDPDRNIITGLDKIVKLVEVYSRRLQIQERLTQQIADAMVEVLDPKGVMVVSKAYHLCVSSRETRNPTTYTTTSAIRGAFEQPATRQEFLSLINVASE